MKKLILQLITLDDDLNLTSTEQDRKKTFFELVNKARKLEDCVKYLESHITREKDKQKKETYENLKTVLEKILND